MTDETGGEAIAELPADAPESFDSPREAAEYFTSLAEKRKEKPAESADTATAATESASQEADAAPGVDQAHGEDEGADPALKEPPIERPKSWTESEEAEWRATPRALQQKIAARELERDTALRRTQNEAADKLKGLTAKEQEVEKARQKYEANQLAPLDRVAILEYEQRQKFPDIKSMEDLQRIAAEATRLWPTDPITAGQLQSYLGEWRTHQDALAVATAERSRIEGQKEVERQGEWTKHVQEQMALATELIPEMADKEKTASLIGRAEQEFLPALGFSKSEINEMSIGKLKLSIFDHRVMKLVSDGMKYADLKAAPKAVAKPDLPAVMRPGTSRPSGQGVDSERLQALNRKPELTIKEATELYTLQNSRRRAS